VCGERGGRDGDITVDAVTQAGCWRGEGSEGCARQREWLFATALPRRLCGWPTGPGAVQPSGWAARGRCGVDDKAAKSGFSSENPGWWGQYKCLQLGEPLIGCRVQQTCKALRGENRRSWEEQQGRNACGGWLPPCRRREAVPRDCPATGSGCAVLMSMGGRSLDNPMRGFRNRTGSILGAFER